MNLELLDFALQMQQPTEERNTFGLWNVDIKQSERNKDTDKERG